MAKQQQQQQENVQRRGWQCDRSSSSQGGPVCLCLQRCCVLPFRFCLWFVFCSLYSRRCDFGLHQRFLLTRLNIEQTQHNHTNERTGRHNTHWTQNTKAHTPWLSSDVRFGQPSAFDLALVAGCRLERSFLVQPKKQNKNHEQRRYKQKTNQKRLEFCEFRRGITCDWLCCLLRCSTPRSWFVCVECVFACDCCSCLCFPCACLLMFTWRRWWSSCQQTAQQPVRI